ncbi:MAG: DeoR/GlpR transcriptional regulator [Rhodobacteraceae bacterium]|nr:DeoR/GlpR transcriptional regulator [Paracoccaceae bacterium]
MHETERHLVILSLLQERPLATVHELVELTQSSEATIRRDLSALDAQKKLRKRRGGAESLATRRAPGLAGRPFAFNKSVNAGKKRAIAKAAVDLCVDGEAIIVNGGTTTFQMVHYLTPRSMQVFTNSFPIAEHLLSQSNNTVTVPGGTIYREQNIILSPFVNDGSKHFQAQKMFMGAQGIGPIGIMEADTLVVQAEEKLVGQADELIILADSSKFERRSSLVFCPLSRATIIITDDGISAQSRAMVEDAGVRLIVVKAGDDN